MPHPTIMFGDIPARELDEILEAGSPIEKIAGGFQFVEGPAWHPGLKELVFSDIIGNTMYRWSAITGVSEFRKPSNMANGNTWDKQGRLLSCEHAASCVSRIGSNGSYEVLASHFNGYELNSPNDIVVSKDGTIFFTDPNSGRGPRYGLEREQQLGFQGVYKLDADTRELTLLVDDFSKPNGLCFSRDESRLFINDTDRQHIRVFDVKNDFSIYNSRVWASTDGDKPGVADGMKIDSAGNLYCCGSGGIHVFGPNATPLGVIETPEVAANFTWGGETLTEMFITASQSVYRLRVKVPGYNPITPEVSTC
jgi:gluconolactonase